MTLDMNTDAMLQVANSLAGNEIYIDGKYVKNKDGKILAKSPGRTFSLVVNSKNPTCYSPRDKMLIQQALEVVSGVLGAQESAHRALEDNITKLAQKRFDSAIRKNTIEILIKEDKEKRAQDQQENRKNVHANLANVGYKFAPPPHPSGTNNCFYDAVAYHYNKMAPADFDDDNVKNITSGSQFRTIASNYAIKFFSRKHLDSLRTAKTANTLDDNDILKYTYMQSIHANKSSDDEKSTKFHDITKTVSSLGDMCDSILLSHATNRPIMIISSASLSASGQPKCVYATLPAENTQHQNDIKNDNRKDADNTVVLPIRDKDGLLDVVAQIQGLGWPADQIITLIHQPGHWSPIEISTTAH
ncbi:MAG: hypothetical protein QS721_10630 [Candidatus Endonucleobacter sp. (ex Gigantidas childressi)]|nr:hypothetical protein [Candidatus Endonucleobacter sp. (ex Gigantidas childressi)]